MNKYRPHKSIRVACLGHDVYFENHYCERSARDFTVDWFSFDHFSSTFYRDIINFRPDITLIFRPEMHTKDALQIIPGIKIGFSLEPMPKIVDGVVRNSSETDRRIRMFSSIDFSAYNAVYHYDSNSEGYASTMGWRFSGYRELPINTDYFHPFNKPVPYWDLVFVGKATPRRSKILQSLKSYNTRFLWVEHGVSGKALAEIFRRANCILNVHADDLVALEPRIYLAAACGVPVLSDDYGSTRFPLDSFVEIVDMTKLSPSYANDCIGTIAQRTSSFSDNELAIQLNRASTATFIREMISLHV